MRQMAATDGRSGSFALASVARDIWFKSDCGNIKARNRKMWDYNLSVKTKHLTHTLRQFVHSKMFLFCFQMSALGSVSGCQSCTEQKNTKDRHVCLKVNGDTGAGSLSVLRKTQCPLIGLASGSW